MKVKAKDKQNLFDISVQEYAEVTYAFMLAKLNNLSLTTTLKVGQEVEVPKIDVDNELLQEYFKNNGVTPTTASPAFKGGSSPALTGIGFMTIGTTFKVY